MVVLGLPRAKQVDLEHATPPTLGMSMLMDSMFFLRLHLFNEGVCRTATDTLGLLKMLKPRAIHAGSKIMLYCIW